MHSHERWNAATLRVGATHSMARCLRSDHHDIDIVTRHNLAVVHVKTVCKRERCTRLNVCMDAFTIDLSDIFVGQEHHDEICCFDCLSDFSDFQARISSFFPRRAVFTQTNDNFNARLMQVQCMCVTLRTVTNNRNGLTFDQGQITIFIVINLHSGLQIFLS